VYHRLGNVGKAITHLNTAIDLDPKEAAGLKVLPLFGVLVLN
jgi:hypothetical protein